MSKEVNAESHGIVGAIALDSLSDNQLLTYTQTAAVLQLKCVSDPSQPVRRLVSNGKLKSVALGHRTKRIRVAALKRFILEREQLA